MASARRIFTYGTALVGLVVTLYAAEHLLDLLLAALLLHNDDTRRDLSLYLATLIVGAPLWLGAAIAANRRARGTAAERDAVERRLFLASAFAVGSVMALFAVQSLLRVALSTPDAPGGTDWRTAIDAGSQLLVYGAAWLYHARAGWSERGPRAADRAHDLAVYVLAAFALSGLVAGLYRAGRRIVDALIGSGGGSSHFDLMTWGDILAWVLAGGVIWGAVWRYDLHRGGRRHLRVLYLYLVLACAVPSALWAASAGIYEALRRLFGYRAAPDSLRDAMPVLLIGGAVWFYHWRVVRAQPARAGEEAGGAIPWPRRPALALLTLLGHAIAVPGGISLIWLGLDALFNHGLRGSEWWRERLSGGVAATLVGGAVWLGAWTVLQRAANASPAIERTARARRLLLGGIVLSNALPAVGFAVALLWLLLRALLGEHLDADALSSALRYLSTAGVLLAVAAIHARVLRADLRIQAAGAPALRVRALIAADAEEALHALERSCDRPIEVVGHLSPIEELPGRVDLPLLQRMVADLGTPEHEACDSVLLLLRPDGGMLLCYTAEALDAIAASH